MNIFTDDAMHRPLFEEPGPNIERTDEWAYPKGFLIGASSGMGGSPGQLDVAQYFMEAAYALSEAINNNDWQDYRIGYPVLYFYRHSLELFLKGVLGGQRRGHDLVELVDEFAASFQQEHDHEVPAWIIRRVKEIAQVDPGSTAFRYAGDYDPENKKGQKSLPGEMYVSVPHLQDAMVALNWALASVVQGFSTERIETLARQHASRRMMD